MGSAERGERTIRHKLIDYTIAFFSLLLLNFFLPRFLPGDPVTALYGEEVTMGLNLVEKKILLDELGVGKPIALQLIHYFKGLIFFDLGYSYHYHLPVTTVIGQFAPWTLLLTGTILTLSILFGFILGVESTWRHGKLMDTSLMAGMMTLNALPPFALGMFVLMILGYHFTLFPIAGATKSFTTATGFSLIAEILYHMAMPVLTMLLHDITNVYFLSRASAITVKDKPFMLVGKSKGLKKIALKYQYMGRNAVAPVLSRFGVMTANTLTGIMFVEVIFSYPGLGTLAVEGVMNHDYPVVQGVFIFIASIVFSINMIIDSMVGILTQRG